MIEIKIDKLKQGQIIADNIISPLGGVLIYKGSHVLEYHKDMLKAFTITTVKVMEDKKAYNESQKVVEIKKQKDIENQKSEKGSQAEIKEVKKEKASDTEFQKQFNKATSLIKNIMLEVEYTKKVPLMEVRNVIKPLLEQICEQPNISLVIGQIRSNEDYTYQHLIGVGVMSTLIAKFLNYKENELMQIGLAGTLHDIGKAKISDTILNKKGSLSNIEYEEIKKHPIYSYELLKNVTGINKGVLFAALEHHERQDGKGYPFGRKAFEVHPYSKIVAVADVFHAMTSNRAYKNAENIFHVLKQIKEDAFGKLDPQVVTNLISNLMAYSIGSTVTLTNGKVGEVVFINNQDPLKPLVKVENEFIDLSRRLDIEIDQFWM